MNKIFCIFLIFVVLVFISCKKDGQDQAEGHLLKRMITNSILQNNDVDTFLYDSENRLIGINAFPGNYNMAIEYDGIENISKVTYSYQGVDKYSFTFVRNAAGQIIHKSVTSYQGFQYGYDQSYAYNSLGQLASDTTYYQQTDSIMWYDHSFKYDNNSNIIEYEFVSSVDPVNSGKTTYLFDTNPNPLNLLGSKYYFVTDNLSYLNKNNFTESKSWWSIPIKRKFTYQKNGLPSKFVAEDPNTPYGPIYTTTQLEYW
jgi:hypothetical protein